MRPFVAVVFLWLPMVVAQVRQPLHGAVRDAAGKPVSGATVTLVWTPLGGDEEGPSDVITCRSNAAGAFAAELLTGEGYSAWAIRDLGGDRFECSAVDEDVAAGGRCELRLGAARVRQQFSLTGAEEWPDHGPLRLFVVPSAANVLRVLVDQGRAPPLPPIGTVLVVGGNGVVLAGRPVLDETRVTVVMSWPLRVSFLAVDVDGRPIAAAEVHAVLASLPRDAGLFARPPLELWSPVATTGADGRASLVLPVRRNGSGADADSIVLRATATGYAAGTHMLSWNGGLGWRRIGIDGREFTKDPAQPVVFTLQSGCRLWLQDRGEPCRDAWVLLHATNARPAIDRHVVRTRLDRAGEAQLPIAAEPFETQLHWRRADGERTLLRLPFSSGTTTAGDLASTRRVAIECRRADGSPAAGVPVLFVPDGSSVDLFSSFPIYTDAGGRCALWLDAGGWLLAACDGAEFGEATIAGRHTGEELVVTMASLPRAIIHSRRADGSAENGPRPRFLDREHVDAGQTRQGIDRLLLQGLWRDARFVDGCVALPIVVRKEGRPRANMKLGDVIRTVELDPAVPAEVVWRK
ncbi:MAG: hypothetical protein IPK26_23110 [Planctomycetes bacterium]|nr:hypothetical protein [Planctomycetota bacterium]